MSNNPHFQQQQHPQQQRLSCAGPTLPPPPPPPPPPVPVGAVYHQIPNLNANYGGYPPPPPIPAPYANPYPGNYPPYGYQYLQQPQMQPDQQQRMSPNYPRTGSPYHEVPTNFQANAPTSPGAPIPSVPPVLAEDPKRRTKLGKDRPTNFNLMQHKHILKPKLFKVPNNCSLCNKFIYGFGLQGFSCIDQDCQYRVHKSCGQKDVQQGRALIEPADGSIGVSMAPPLPPYPPQIRPMSVANGSPPPLPPKLTQTNPKQLLKEASYMINRSDLKFGQHIGSGACGEVYNGRLFGAEVAIKVLSLNPEQFKRVTESFYHELDIMLKLHHPNIILLMGACVEENQLMIVMEYSHKGSLHDLLHEKHSPELTWSIRLRLAEDTALGINWLHKQKPQIVHRDLKTANILVDRNLVGKLCDFGISQVFEGLDKDKGFYGSPIYSAPECLLQRPYDAKVDCFSYSYVLWELVTELIPYEGLFQTFNQLVETVVINGYRAPIPPTCHPLLADLISRCWKAMPQDRPSFQEILDSEILRNPEVLAQEPTRQPPPLPSPLQS